MKWLQDYLQLPKQRAWLGGLIAVWVTVLLAPFAWLGESWGMIFYILTWPVSELLKTFYEDLKLKAYVGLVCLVDTGWALLIGLVVYNSVRIYRANRRGLNPPSSPPTGTSTTVAP